MKPFQNGDRFRAGTPELVSIVEPLQNYKQKCSGTVPSIKIFFLEPKLIPKNDNFFFKVKLSHKTTKTSFKKKSGTASTVKQLRWSHHFHDETAKTPSTLRQKTSQYISESFVGYCRMYY